MAKSRATIHDVAKEANVSLATVSRVVNGIGNVNEETAKLVLKAIEKLGYVPSNLARGLARSKTTTVALVLPSPNYVYLNNMLSGMLSVCKIYGYNPVLFTYENKEDMKDVVKKVISSRVEGIVLFNSELSEQDLMQFNNISLPVVLIGDDKFNLKNTLVNIDYFSQIVAYIQRLNAQKIKKIYFIKDPNKDWHMISSFENAIKSGLSMNPIPLEVVTISDSYDVIYEYFFKEFQQKDQWKDTLIIATRDSLAIAVNNAALDQQIAIPQHVQTIGIIGTKNSRMSRPTISIFDVDYFEIGSISTRMLTKMLAETLTNNRFNFATEYIKRDSTQS